MNKNLFKLDYKYNKNVLLYEALDEKGWTNFTDPSNNHVFENWYVKKVKDGYAQEITNFFSNKIGVDIKSRFFHQKSGWSLQFHRDRGTQCSINFILSGGEDQISFRDGSYEYECALLNTQEEHAVLNPKNDRVMLKLSIFDKNYYEVLECITA